MVLHSWSALFAQGNGTSNVSIGLNTANTVVPEEADFKSTGGHGEIDKFEIYFDINRLRFALNAVHGLNTKKESTEILTSNSLYMAYLPRLTADNSNWDIYLLGGFAIVYAYTWDGDEQLESSDDYGYVVGTGMLYQFSQRLNLGIQLIRISARGIFGDERIETGSDQIQMVIKYSL